MENWYFRTDTDLYSVVREQFRDAMQRESRTVTDYWSGKTYSCIFRRNADTNQTNDNSTMYYDTDAGIKEGSLISYGNQVYLVLNREASENDIYRKSDSIRTNVMLSTYSDGYEINLPCFAYDLTTPDPSNSSVITIVSGNSELMTGDCEASRLLTIDSQFDTMGGVYSITNLNYKDGICRITTQRVAANTTPIEYGIKIISEETYAAGSAVTLQAAATRTEGTVNNPTLKWSTSDSSIATVSGNGTILFTGLGTVAISCLWVEHGCTDTVTVTVVEPTENYTCTIDGRTDLRAGMTRTYTAIFYDTDGNIDETITPVWSLDLPAALTGKVTITATSGNTITLTATDDSYGNTFTLRLTDPDEKYHASLEIEIVSLF